MNILDFQHKKTAREKITMTTCYDYTSARILANTSVDIILVGDSAAMIMHGYKDTLPATIEMMCWHTAAVCRGAGKQFIVSDMPFLSYRKSLDENISAVQALVTAGAQAIKLEGAKGNLELIQHLVESGVPVMGHIGLTAQSVCVLGGFKVQGKTDEDALRIKQEALALQTAGCFALVLECIPPNLAEEITNMLSIPTIGIGAGSNTDGQVLVMQDLLGLNIEHKPKFVKNYLNGFELICSSVEQYVNEVKTGAFPANEHCYAAR